MIEQHLKDLVDAKLAWCANRIFDLYSVNVEIKQIDYDLDGFNGGEADYINQRIRLHPVFLRNHTEDYIEQTVVHEFAHIANDILFPEDLSACTGNRKAHGKNWKHLMEVLGAKPRIGHHYNVEYLYARKKHRNYMCTCCNKDIKVSQVLHRRIMEGAKYFHNKCSTPIIFVGP